MTSHTHPACGGLTDAEREALFLIAYREHTHWIHIYNYLLRMDLGDPVKPMSRLLKDEIVSRDDDEFWFLSGRGLAIIKALEAGGW